VNVKNQYQAKELVASARDILNNMKLVQHNLLVLIESVDQIKDVAPDLEEFTGSALIEMQNTRGTIAESIATANALYYKALDELKGGES